MSFCIFHCTNAQEWFPVGASWYYSQTILFQGESYVRFEVTGETTINGKTCKVISGNCNCGVSNAGGNLYQEGDKIYTYDAGADTFRLLYDFTLEAGDTLFYHIDDPWVTDGMFLIDSITTMQFGSDTLRVQHITHLAYDVVWGNKIIERIGSSGCLYPQISFCDPGTGGLRCYEDQEIGLINFQVPERPCDYISVSTGQVGPEKCNIYPNPTTDVLHIETDLPIDKIELINSVSLRSPVTSVIFNSYAEMDTGLLPPGMYYLKIFYGDGHVRISPVVLQD